MTSIAVPTASLPTHVVCANCGDQGVTDRPINSCPSCGADATALCYFEDSVRAEDFSLAISSGLERESI